MKPTLNEQVESILKGTACDLVERYVPAERLSSDSYKEVFTINKDQILTYVQSHYQLEDLVHTRPGTADGFYALLSADGYVTYEQERQLKAEETEFNNIENVWRKFVDYLITCSGTGLKFE